MFSLYIRNIIFFILQPGIVVGFIPYMIVRKELMTSFSGISIFNYIGLFFIILGLFIVIYCIYRFIIDGKGTLSPFDRTKVLVIKGLYKYSRNPMYVGIIITLLGEVLFVESLALLFYTVIVFIAFHLFVIFIEEPRLKRDFKELYIHYTSLVKRWL